MWRLGPPNLFDKAHPSGHYVLDTANPTHEQVSATVWEGVYQIYRSGTAHLSGHCASDTANLARTGRFSSLGGEVYLKISLPMLPPPAQLARKLIDLANQSSDFPNFWNMDL